MSLRAMIWALEEAECRTPAAKLVLWVFSNYVDTDGYSRPSCERIARMTKLDPRTVRVSINYLIEDGLIEDSGRKSGNTGRVVVYRLLGTIGTELSPLHDNKLSRPRKGAHQPKTGLETAIPAKVHSLNEGSSAAGIGTKVHNEPVTGTITPKDPDGSLSPEGRKNGRRSRISGDWAPPPIGQLPDTIRAIAEQWPAGAYETQAEAHRAYRAAGNAKRDWTSDWHARIVQIGAQPLRDAKAGMTFGTPVAAPPTKPPAPIQIVFAKPDEAEPLGAWRAAAAAAMGDASYRRLLDAAHLEVDDEQLIVTVATPITEMQIREGYEYCLTRLVRRVLDRRLLRLQVDRRAA